MILNIKTAVRSHIPEMVAVIESYTDESLRKTELYDKYYFGSSLLKSLLTAVITCDKTVRGVVICCESKIPDSCEIDVLYISDGFQRRGFGKKLLSHALREMRAKRYKTAFLWINENNEAAINFFTKFGFECDGKRRRDTEINNDTFEKRFRIDI